MSKPALHFVLKTFIGDIFQITEKKQKTIFWQTFDVVIDVSIFDVVKGLHYRVPLFVCDSSYFCFQKMKNHKQITAYYYPHETFTLQWLVYITFSLLQTLFSFTHVHGVKISIFMSFRLGRASLNSYAAKQGRLVAAVLKSTLSVARILSLKVCSKINVQRWP